MKRGKNYFPKKLKLSLQMKDCIITTTTVFCMAQIMGLNRIPCYSSSLKLISLLDA